MMARNRDLYLPVERPRHAVLIPVVVLHVDNLQLIA
jgi:hypothetical protein